ncbi:outer membrane porin, OprD family [Pseudomonas sp. 5Ae-yellow]|nr:hypothetical protein [Pseudomonadales bacterium]MBA6421787.1 outer membrane porin, OprD family [Pseudomonas sp. 5Ae-yellow]
MNKGKLLFSILALGMGSGGVAAADQADGFVEGSSLNITNRNFYFNRDSRNGQSTPLANGYSEEWAHAVIGEFQSGFTRGTVGFGIDAFAMLGRWSQGPSATTEIECCHENLYAFNH